MSLTDATPPDMLLKYRIARCELCTGGPVVLDWLPISYYGDYEGSNAWVVTINPSDQEFLDRNGQVKSGPRQRFSRLEDFPHAKGRASITDSQVREALARQEAVFYGSPYRSFFEKLGRFLVMVHGADVTPGGIRVFTAGVKSREGREFRYSHMDTVKCATRRPWAHLDPADKQQLLANCLGYMEEQFRTRAGLELVLLNGRTAYNHCRPFLSERFGFQPGCHKVTVGRLSYQVWVGRVKRQERFTDILGWSPNIVNSRIRNGEAKVLAEAIRQVCPGLR